MCREYETIGGSLEGSPQQRESGLMIPRFRHLLRPYLALTQARKSCQGFPKVLYLQ
jgi:hypothetical protein